MFFSGLLFRTFHIIALVSLLCSFRKDYIKTLFLEPRVPVKSRMKGNRKAFNYETLHV